MRVVFCGSGSFGAATLQAIMATAHEVTGVVTQPPRPAGRGGKARKTPAADIARQGALSLLESPDVNSDEAVEAIRRMEPDAICVAEFGQMVRGRVRETALHGAFNVHASLLPELRGAAPVNWAIIRGCKRTGVTTFSLVDRMDAGPIYLQMTTDILPSETSEGLRVRLAELGAEAACKTLDQLAQGMATSRQQDESQATLAPRLRKSDGRIDWAGGAEGIRNLIHGVWPWPGGQTVFCTGSREVPVIIASAQAEQTDAPGSPGVLDADGCVGTGLGRLRVLRIKPAGRRLMEWRDFVNGCHAAPGDRFRTLTDRDDAE